MTERERFEEYLFSTEKFEFRNKAFLFMLDEDGEYEDQPVLEHWKTWQAATQREGFKFVPVEADNYMKVSVRDFYPDIDRCESMSKCDWEELFADVYKAMVDASE